MEHYAVWVRVDVSKLEAFASIGPILADQFLVYPCGMNFLGATLGTARS